MDFFIPRFCVISVRFRTDRLARLTVFAPRPIILLAVAVGTVTHTVRPSGRDGLRVAMTTEAAGALQPEPGEYSPYYPVRLRTTAMNEPQGSRDAFLLGCPSRNVR
jgi:hypothetical protein